MMYQAPESDQYRRRRKMLNNDRYVDIVLIAGEHRIKANKDILSESSAYFAALFNGQWLETSQSEMEIKDVDGSALGAIVKYLYTGTIEVNVERVGPLLETARRIAFTDIDFEAFCVARLKAHISIKTVFNIREFADGIQCDGLLAPARDFMINNFTDVIKEEAFKLLPVQEVTYLISQQRLNVPAEETVYHAIKGWIDYSPKERSIHAGELMEHVRVPFLDPVFVTEHVCEEPVIYENLQARKIIDEGREYHLIPEMRQPSEKRTTGRPSYSGTLHAVGVTNHITRLESYDTSSKRWELAGTFPGSRHFSAITGWIDGIVSIGGRSETREVTGQVEYYDLSADKKTRLPDLNNARFKLTAASLKHAVFAVGGFTARGRPSNSVEVFAPELHQRRFWKAAPMVHPRAEAAVTVHRDKLYVFGGHRGNSIVSSNEVYHPNQNRWSETSTPWLNIARSAAGTAVINNAIYVVGGQQGLRGNGCTNTMERVDPRCCNLGWMLAPMPKGARSSVGVCAIDEKLYVTGGEDNTGQSLRRTEVYYPAVNRWESVADTEEVSALHLINIPRR